MPVLIQVLLFPFAATLEVTNATIAIYNEDSGRHAVELTQRFARAKAFTHVLLLQSPQAIQPTIDEQKALLVVRFPADFSRNLDNYQTAPLQLLLDGRNSNSAQIAANYLQQIVKNYQGGDVLLNAEKQIYIKVSEHPELNQYIGSDLITTDGTSVLGADNKAAVANLMVALETIIKEGRPHGEIYVALFRMKRLAFAVPRRWISASSRLNLLIPLTAASWARLYIRPLTQAAHTSKSRA